MRGALAAGAGISATVAAERVSRMFGPSREPLSGGYAPGADNLSALRSGTVETIWSVDVDSPLVALTFDDGPQPHWTPMVLDELDRVEAPATFFMIGEHLRANRGLVAGRLGRHEVGNHTWSHPSTLAQQPGDQVRDQLHRAQDKIYSATSVTPTVFRSPGGAWSPTVFAESAQARMVPLGWTEDPRDWTKPGVGAITDRLMAARPGEILLCHDGGGDRSQTCAALNTVIPALQARGYQFVALDGQP